MIDGSDDYEPGCIYHIGKNDMYVQTGKGALSLVEVQLRARSAWIQVHFERLSCGRGLIFTL